MKLTQLCATGLISLVLGFAPASLFAAEAAGTDNSAAVKRGEAKSATCAACHGPDGNSLVAQWPKIAGQHADYLIRHIELIKQGQRQVNEMAPMVIGLSAQDIADLAAYYAAQPRKAGVASEALIADGKQLYMAGNPETGVPACMACHGPAGDGIPLTGYPALAGQHAVYTSKMLHLYKAGETWGEDDANSAVMTGVAKALSADEIKAVASYIEGLHGQ